MLGANQRAGQCMRMIVAGKAAGVRSPRIRDGIASIGRDDIDVEIHEPLSGNGSAHAAHAMRGVAS